MTAHQGRRPGLFPAGGAIGEPFRHGKPRGRSLVRLVLCLVLLASAQGAAAETLRLPDVLEKAIAHSYELQLDALEIEIGRARLAEARAAYFPTLTLRLTNEYLDDLRRDGTGTIAVGETILSGSETTYQNSLSVYAGCLLHDFGGRDHRYRNAERDMRIAELRQEQSLRDLKDKIVEVYGRNLVLCKQRTTWETILAQRNEIYRLSERLHDAGVADKVELGTSAIAVAEAVQALAEYRLEFAEALQDLAFLTGEGYDEESVTVSDLPEADCAAATVQVRDLPEIRAYGLKIDRKQAEYEIARRQWLPSLHFYSSYRMYGRDSADPAEALQGMRAQNATVGIVVDLNLFNGFGDLAELDRLRSQRRSLEVERRKMIADKEREIAGLTIRTRIYERGTDDWFTLAREISEQEHMNQKLAGQQVIDRIGFLRRQEEMLIKSLAQTVRQVQSVLASLRLQYMAGEGVR
ncbi:MAG: TolC family protein [Thermodesulfobacteriota bacterium]